MNSPRIFPAWLAALWLGAALCGRAAEPGVRVAVAGDPSLASLVDVTAAELSGDAGIAVLDRADLDKLGQEQALRTALAAKDYAPVRVLPADGLVLLRAIITAGQQEVFARLVAVQPRVVLREFALPDGAEPIAQAKAIAREFSPCWPKLAAIRKGKISTLSLLGLRFDIDAPENRELERSFNLLLSSRLGAEPDTLVLERWRLNDALFEKSLSVRMPSPFWTGSSLIDGSLRRRDGMIAVALRVRPPQGGEISLTDQDTPEQLPALVDRLAEKIRQRPAAPMTWKPADEAAHYADLGVWCLDNGLAGEGVEAMESAVALGDTSADVRLLRVKAYALAAYPKDARALYSNYDFYSAKAIAPDSIGPRIDAATMAATLMEQFLKDDHGPYFETDSPAEPPNMGIAAFESGLGVLRSAYDNKYQQDHADAVASLRHAIQKLIVQLDARLLPMPGKGPKQAYLRHRMSYAGLCPVGDLRGLVDKILAPIQTAAGAGTTAGTWQPQIEAAEYLREGIWAWHAGQPQVALEALDSAELLGETAPDLLATRIDTCCQLGGDVTSLSSTVTGIDWMDRHFGQANKSLPADPRPQERTEILLRAMADWQTYADAKGESRLSLLVNIPNPNGTMHINYGDTRELQKKVLYASSKVLAMLDALHDPHEESFREALRNFAGFDPRHQRMPVGGVFALDYADEWSESAEEELAYLHHLCAGFVSDDDLRSKLEQVLFSTGAANFCPRFALTADDQKALFGKWVAGLLDDPATKPVGWAVRVTWDDPGQRAADFHLLLDDLWNERDALLQASRLEGLIERAVALQSRISTPADPQLVALFHYDLQHHDPGPIGAIPWHPDLFPPADAPSLWDDLEALKARATANAAKAGPNMAPVFQAAIGGEYAKLEQAYIAKWGNPEKIATAAAGADSGPLVVNRYWCSWRADVAPPIAAQQIFSAGGMDGTLWIYGYDIPPENAVAAVDGHAAVPAGLFQIHLPDLKTTGSLNPRPVAPDGLRSPVMAVAPDAVYIATTTDYQPVKCVLDRFQISTRKWESREMSQLVSEIFPVADKIYFSFQGASGLARYDWESGQTILLASSRRRPAQNQFDERAPYNVASVFAAPDGQPCAQIEHANYVIQETPGNWKLQSKLGLFPGMPQEPQAGFFPDPSGLRVSTNEPQFQPMSKEFTWYLACREKIDAQRKGDPIGYAYRGGSFLVLGRTDDGYTLWWAQPGKTDPIAIPLKLMVDDATLAEMKDRYGDAMASVTSPMKSPAATVSMTVTSEGLGLTGEKGGFWFIPFHEIDAYLAAHGAGPTAVDSITK